MRTGLSQLEDTSNSKTHSPDEPREDSSPTRVSPRRIKLRDIFQGAEASIPLHPRRNWKFGRWLAIRARSNRALYFSRCMVQTPTGTLSSTMRFPEERRRLRAKRPCQALFLRAWRGFKCERRARPWPSPRQTFLDIRRCALQLVAVTGTNGKTTTTSLVDAIVKASGAKTGLFGTIAYHTPLGEYPAPNTTPESVDLQGFLAEIRDAGGRFGVLEASSHSLAMDRLWGCHFAAAVFTNLTREHMDYHKTFEDYFAAKKRLFEGTGAGAPEIAVLNSDDAYGKRLAGLAKKTVTYGLESDADITTRKFQLTFNGLTFTAQTPNGKVQVASSLVGRINVYNILAAIGAAQALGLSTEIIESGIRSLESVSGRFQRIDLGQPYFVVVDYAHTDDALENLIRTARELNPKGRIITLFGCGGGKDRTKRP